MPRNSSGNYTLPAGNPVAPNTLIETAWANPTCSDIGSEITNSLDRQGRGTMLAPLRIADGTVGAPALAFNSEASTGWYKPAAHILALAVAGAQVAAFADTGIAFKLPTVLEQAVTMNTTLAVTGALTVGGALTLTGPFTPAGVINLPLGTAPLPSLTFQGDPNTGLYSPGADTLAFATSGLQRALVGPAGGWTFNAHDTPGSTTVTVGSSVGGVDLALVSAAASDAIMRITATGVRNWQLRANTADTFALRDDSRGQNVFTASNAGNFTLVTPASGGHVIHTNDGGVGVLFNGATRGIRFVFGANSSIEGVDQTGSGSFQPLYLNGSTLNFTILGAPAQSIAADGKALFQFNVRSMGDMAAANYTINDGAAATAGTFGFIAPANGPYMQMWGVGSAGAGKWNIVTTGGSVQQVATGQVNITSGNVVNTLFNFPASGGYTGYFVGASGIGYIGSANALLGGAVADLALRADGALYIGSGATTRMVMLSPGGIQIPAQGAAVSLFIAGASTGTPTLQLSDTGSPSGINLLLVGNGATTPSKTIRCISGALEVVNSAYSAVILSLTDAGALVIGAAVPAGDNTQKAATTAFLQTSTVGSTSRTWQNMTGVGGRALNVVITSPAYPIEISFNFNFPATNGTTVTLNVGGNIITSLSNGVSGAYAENITAVIPPNTNYALSSTVGTPTISSWWELR